MEECDNYFVFLFVLRAFQCGSSFILPVAMYKSLRLTAVSSVWSSVSVHIPSSGSQPPSVACCACFLQSAFACKCTWKCMHGVTGTRWRLVH